MTDIWRSADGMYGVEVTSASLEACFERMNSTGIQAFSVQRKSELSAEFVVKRRDLRKLKAICSKHGDKLELREKLGLHWKLRKVTKRPILLAGFLLLGMLTLYLPRHILFVQVEGNTDVPQKKILEAAESCGIVFGAFRESVRSEQVKNGLLSLVPELKWAGVNTKGCVAVISVREGAKQVDVVKNSISSVVAERDGVVVSCTATRGNLLVKEGQVVKKGQVLISAYTDCGLSIQATRAEGEVFAQTLRKIRAVKPVEYRFRVDAGEPVKCFGILIGKKRINLWKDSGIWDATCGRMYQEYYLILPGGFRLPLAVYVETVTPYVTAVSGISKEEEEASIADDAQEYLLQNMVAGTVLSSRTQTVQLDGLAVLEGTFLCTEMIGRMQTEQIGEEHGKTN